MRRLETQPQLRCCCPDGIPATGKAAQADGSFFTATQQISMRHWCKSWEQLEFMLDGSWLDYFGKSGFNTTVPNAAMNFVT